MLKKLLSAMCLVMLLAVGAFAAPTQPFTTAKEMVLASPPLANGDYRLYVKAVENGSIIFYAIIYLPKEQLIVCSISEHGRAIAVGYDEENDDYEVGYFINGELKDTALLNAAQATAFMENVLEHLSKGGLKT